jgi:hypothetical protein
MPILHIVNGDTTRQGLERSSVPGTFRSWADILHEGPVPAGVAPDEWRRVRVRYLASHGYGDEQAIAAQYAREDAALDRWADHDEVVFWFEHDLYDQLILIRHLAWIGQTAGAAGTGDARRSPSPSRGGSRSEAPQKPLRGGDATRFTLVCDDTYLGPLTPEQFPALFAMREPITPAQIDLGTRAWQAFCSGDPRSLIAFARTPSRDLPFLAGALHRHLQDFPSTTNGLGRSEREILQILSAADRSPEEVFGALAATEERIFMGDASFWTIARRLADGPHPLLAVDVRERPGRLPAGVMRITGSGRDVLSGRTDQIALNGIDRWMGGVHLTPSRCWRWDGSDLVAW